MIYRGIFNTTATLCFSSLLGIWIDRAPSRLRTLLTTIVTNRCAVLLACACWIFLVDDHKVGAGTHRLSPVTTPNHSYPQEARAGPLSSAPTPTKDFLFALAVLLGTLEKLSGVANMICMERDWIPLIASQAKDATTSSTYKYDLTHLNASMRRIDLICKLIAPILISVLISATKSTRYGVLAVAGMNALSWPADYICARRVYDASPQLRQSKQRVVEEETDNPPQRPSSTVSFPAPPRPCPTPPRHNILALPLSILTHTLHSLRTYFSTPVWQPSLALATLHLSVLSYSATFLTYLLDTGFSLVLITVVRALSSVVEVSSTVVTPWGVRYLSLARPQRQARHVENADDRGTQDGVGERLLLQTDGDDVTIDEARPTTPQTNAVGLERLGLWGINWQLLTTIPVVLALWQLSPTPTPTPTASALSTPTQPSSLPPEPHHLLALPSSSSLIVTILFTFLSLTRLGLWTFDLTTTELTQTRVPASTRSSFAGTEMALVSGFELAQWVAAAVWARPEDFRWLAVGSLGAVGVAAGVYAGWVRGRRGHLLHLEEVVGRGCECVKGRGR